MLFFCLLTLFLQVFSKSVVPLENDQISLLFNDTLAVWIHRNGFGIPKFRDWIQPVNNSNITIFASIDSRQSKLLALLEVKTIPSLKYVEKGKVFTLDGIMVKEQVRLFLEDPYKTSLYFNYLSTVFKGIFY
jgi:hypothetical protein